MLFLLLICWRTAHAAAAVFARAALSLIAPLSRHAADNVRPRVFASAPIAKMPAPAICHRESAFMFDTSPSILTLMFFAESAKERYTRCESLMIFLRCAPVDRYHAPDAAPITRCASEARVRHHMRGDDASSDREDYAMRGYAMRDIQKTPRRHYYASVHARAAQAPVLPPAAPMRAASGPVARLLRERLTRHAMPCWRAGSDHQT